MPLNREPGPQRLSASALVKKLTYRMRSIEEQHRQTQLDIDALSVLLESLRDEVETDERIDRREAFEAQEAA